MGNFDIRVKRFIDVFINAGAYNKVLLGLKNTIIIAVLGLVIGILIGTLIATIRVLPKYRRLPRILNGFCSFYVSLFRGTPVVVQLLVFYYVLLPLLNIKMTSVAHPVESCFGLTFPIFLVINICFFIFWLIIQKYKFALFPLVAFLLCYSQIRTYFPLNFHTSKLPENSFKVLSYNIMEIGRAHV